MDHPAVTVVGLFCACKVLGTRATGAHGPSNLVRVTILLAPADPSDKPTHFLRVQPGDLLGQSPAINNTTAALPVLNLPQCRPRPYHTRLRASNRGFTGSLRVYPKPPHTRGPTIQRSNNALRTVMSWWRVQYAASIRKEFTGVAQPKQVPIGKEYQSIKEVRLKSQR